EPKIEISKDRENWFTCKDFFLSDNMLELYFYGKKDVQFIRIDREIFKNAEITIFVRKYLGIFMMQSCCGWGDRMLALLNAMYLAQETGFKFGFTWDQMTLNIKNKQIHSGQIPYEQELFDEQFLRDYSYTNNYTAPDKEKFLNNQWIDNYVVYVNKIEDYNNIEMQYYWGFNTNHSNLIWTVKEINKEYCKNFPDLWKKIQFTDLVKHIFLEVDRQINKIMDNQVDVLAIHMRSGDIVYPEDKGYIYNGTGHDYLWQKAMPVEILMELIQTQYKHNKIILFGEDVPTLKKIISYFMKKNIFLYMADDLVPFEYKYGWQRDMFDLILMSKANKIIGGTSGFCRLASLIGNGREPFFWNDLFNEEARYKIFKKYYGVVEVHPLQNAFSLQHMYMGCYLKRDFIRMKELVLNAINIDQVREFHHIALIYCYLELKEYNQANIYLEHILKTRKEKFTYIILRCIFNLKLKDLLLSHLECLEYPNIAYLFIQFTKEDVIDFFNKKTDVISYYYDDTAIFRVKNSLSYKLGNTILKVKISEVLFLPLIICKIVFHFKIQQIIYRYVVKQNPKLKLKSLEQYDDYMESLKIREHLSYKLGNAFIKHPFSFIFRINAIYKQWRNKEIE
ncbi:TPA: hypothetical protein ACIKZN_001404, partial [Campylobacter jejuni]